MPEFEFPTPRPLKKSQLRYWTGKLWDLGWYRWVRARLVRARVRLIGVPFPHPVVIPVPMLKWRICVWEGRGLYCATGIIIPGTNIELLIHQHSNRIVGVKIWD